MKFLRIAKEKGFENRGIKFYLILIVVLWIVYSFFGGRSGLIKMYQIGTENRNLVKENLELEKKIELLKDTLKLFMEKDSHTIEKEAREKWGMSKKGERVIKFLDKE